ncbi:MAG: symmetrical bis(5'-nucleosyl)-tetraphosphatase [Acidobacteriota bacterium]
MAEAWAVGDVHGRFATLTALLGRLDFDDASDSLFLLGDLVNRGPASLAVLRWARARSLELGDRFACVLGNHDLHLLAAAAGLRRAGEDLEPVLDAPDADELLGWLRERPLLHRHGPFVLVHAGLWPDWTIREAERQAAAVAARLRAGDHRLLNLKAEAPPELRAEARALYGFTSLRLLDARGGGCSFKGPPEQAPPGSTPWFAAADRSWAGARVVFGHWAALGVRLGADFCGLDSGAAWDRGLTALRLSDRRLVHQENLD